MGLGGDVDSSNACIPLTSPLSSQFPPLPTTTRGVPLVIDGTSGRYNEMPLLLYGNGRLVIVRFLEGEVSKEGKGEGKGGGVGAFIYRGHTAHVNCAKFSPSGSYVASGDVRGNLRIWSYDNEEHLCKLDLKGAIPGPIRDVSWDGDGKRICLVGDTSNDHCRVIQYDTGVTCGDLGQHVRGRASTCTFRKKRPMRIITGGGEDNALILNGNIPFVKMKIENKAHVRGGVNCVRYSWDGERVASVGGDRRVVFYEGKGMDVVKVMEGVHEGSIYFCDWSRDDQFLLTCAADGQSKLISTSDYTIVKTWDIMSHRLEGLPYTKDDNIYRSCFGALQLGCAFVRGDVPLSIGVNGDIAILSQEGEGSGVRLLTGHQAPIASMTVDGDADLIYTGDSDGVICQWNANTGECERIPRKGELTDEETVENMTLMGKVHSGTITAMGLCGGDLISVGWDDVVRVGVTGEGGKRVVELKLTVESQPNALAVGKDLAVICMVGGVCLYKDRKLISPLLPLSYTALSACLTSDDSTIIIGGDDKNIHIYSVDLSSPSNPLTETKTISDGHFRDIHSLRLSPDETLLASADARDVCIWDVKQDYKPIIAKNRWCFHSQKITSLAWSPSGNILASGGLDDNIYLWSLKKKMTRIHYPFSHRGGVTGLHFRTEDLLVSSGGDGCVCGWNVAEDVKKKKFV